MGRFLSLVIAAGLFAAACSPADVKSPSSEVKIVDESLTRADLLKPGSFDISEYEYSSPAAYDADVFPSTNRKLTDIRGRIYLPEGQGPFPLIVLLHGNHGTCGIETGEGNPRLDISIAYTSTGECPSPLVETPSYRGYDDSARLLASWGYAVASINANLGITGANNTSSSAVDSALVSARGKHVLRHIEELYKWSRDGRNSLVTANGLQLKDKLDFSKVGLMGHSRGGEGVRYAYNLYTNSTSSAKWQARIPGLKFQGIFEIGPVDNGNMVNGVTTKIEARGVAWNVLIPGCDGDVSDFSGVRPFERMESDKDDGFPKSVFTVWGANHNFFNTQWQSSDAGHTCKGTQKPLWDTTGARLPGIYSSYDSQAREGLTGSDTQIKFEKALMLAFFHSHLGDGKSDDWDHIFDPQYRLPAALSSLADTSREYYVATNSKSVFDPKAFVNNYDGAGSVKNLADVVAKEVQDARGTLSSNSRVRSAAVIASPAQVSSSTSFEDVYLPFVKAESGRGFWTLDIALALKKICANPSASTCKLKDDFEVALELEDGTVTDSVNLQDYVDLQNWYSNFAVKSPYYGGSIYDYIPVLYQTTRFELTDFGVTDEAISGVHLRFKPAQEVSLIVESIRLTKKSD